MAAGRTAVAFVLLLVASQALPCSPTREWMRLTTTEKVERLFDESSVVAWIRVTELPSKGRWTAYGTNVEMSRQARVEVIESFKGPRQLSSVSTVPTSCGMAFWKGQELLVFSDEKLVLHGLRVFRNEELRNALPRVRQLSEHK